MKKSKFKKRLALLMSTLLAVSLLYGCGSSGSGDTNNTDNNSGTEGEPVATVEQCTYMAFRNKSYENKWFYCFVDDFNYINDKAAIFVPI